MAITSFDHYTVRSHDLDAAWRFYEQALGLKVEARQGLPPGVKAAIVWCGDTQVVHLFQASEQMEAIFARMPSREQVEGWMTGRLHHVEFWATGLPEMRQRLKANGISFSERPLADKYQVGMTDPDNIQVNLNFPLAEAGA
jgi:catechol 2,3-dioxygenase-like lactoylglutathione lyase family enzyme